MAQAETIHYDLFWGGLHLAEVSLSDQQRTVGYHLRLRSTTHGMFADLSGLMISAESWGQRTDAASMAPNRFEVDTRDDDGENRLAVEYSPDIVARVVLDLTTGNDGRNDDEPPRPPVPPELRRQTLDPLSAPAVLGRSVIAKAAGGQTDHLLLPIYDGRQRYDVRADIKGPQTTTVHDRALSGIAVELTFLPMAGFHEDSRVSWDNARFNVLINPDNGLPLHVVSENTAVATVINLAVPKDE